MKMNDTPGYCLRSSSIPALETESMNSNWYGVRSADKKEFLTGNPAFIIMAITGQKIDKSFYKYIKLNPKDSHKLQVV